jgi:hypothetical protein
MSEIPYIMEGSLFHFLISLIIKVRHISYFLSEIFIHINIFLNARFIAIHNDRRGHYFAQFNPHKSFKFSYLNCFWVPALDYI